MLYADVLLSAALMIIVTHEIFTKTSFLDILKEKLSKTIDKVKNREMDMR